MFDPSTLFNDLPAPAPDRVAACIQPLGTDPQVWRACQELRIDEDVTAVVMERHRDRADDSLLQAAVKFAATPGWGRGLSESEIIASGITARHVAMAMQDYVRAILFVASEGRLPFEPE